MEDTSSRDQETFHSNLHPDKSALLEIWVDKEQNLLYNCDWSPGTDGINAVSAILYKIMMSDLGLQILQEIQQECVSNNNEADYYMIQNTIRRYSAREDNNINGDDVVIPPDKIEF